jgi:orotidine-5'-phosphate decarboxylase
MQATDKLIVALDVPTAQDALSLVGALDDTISFYKVGMQLYFAEGNAVVKELIVRKKRVFLDLKIHDIPETVALAVGSLARLGIDYLTLFTDAEQIAAARKVVDKLQIPLKLLNVTVLTSQDSAIEAVERRAELSLNAGADGIICSGHETAVLRARFGALPIIVTPGIRPAGGEKNDAGAGRQGSAARTDALFADDHEAGRRGSAARMDALFADDHEAGRRGSAARMDALFADDHEAGRRGSAARMDALFADDQVRVVTPAEAIRAGATNIVVGRPITRAKDPRAAAEAIIAEIGRV